jgi:hypothetical protein
MKCIIGIILCLIGLGSIICAGVFQQVLCYQMFGVVFEKMFIPHWSALFYLGIVPLCVGWAMVQMG